LPFAVKSTGKGMEVLCRDKGIYKVNHHPEENYVGLKLSF